MSDIQKGSFLERLAARMDNDMEFRRFHELECRKGVFRFIKSSFTQMLQLLKDYAEKEKNQEWLNMEQIFQRGGKVFGYYEYKLFTWVSVWLIHRHRITIDQIRSVSLSVLEHLFTTKHPSVIRFQFFLILSLISRSRRKWSLKESRFLQDQMATLLPFDSHNDPKINWKIISYRMFFFGLPPRTPHECRERWINHSNPQIHKSKWSREEDIKLLNLYDQYGPKWSFLAKLIPHRNEHMIKNRINSLRNKHAKKHPSRPFHPPSLIAQLSAQNVLPSSTRTRRRCRQIKQEVKEEEDSIPIGQVQCAIVIGRMLDEDLLQPSEEEVMAAEPASSNPQKGDTLTDQAQIGQECSEASREGQMEAGFFSLQDYEWVDRLIESHNSNWLEFQ